MKQNELPRTQLKLSQISFGAGTAAGLMVNGTRSDQIRAVRKAIDAGINHFDTAPLYGFGSSETNLGAVLQEVNADVLITTKFNVPAEFLQCGSIKTFVRSSVHQSLARLRRDHIDILLIHNATHLARDLAKGSNPFYSAMGNLLPHVSLDDLLGPEGVCEAVNELRKGGLVRYFGVSGQDNNPIALKAVIGAGKIDIFNQPFNLLNPSAGFPQARRLKKVPSEFVSEQADYIDFQDVVEFARANSVGASVISPLAAGALSEEALSGEPALQVSDRGPRFPRPGQYQRELALARRFLPVARQCGISVAELAYRFVLSAPGVVTVVGGFSNSEQMLQAAKAAERGPLQADVLDAIFGTWYGTEPALEASRS